MQASEEIKNRLELVDFIKDYIQLTPAGMNFRARCPFHNEKSPSFMVSPDKQIWHCFGCGKGGDIFKFLMELEGIEFVEALRILAQKAGVTLRRQNPKEVSERIRLLDIVEISRKFYHNYLLTSPSAEAARKYLQKRGLDKDTIEEWQIGASPDSWDSLLQLLKKQGYTEKEIEKTGMIIQNTQKNSYFDRFRGRIMFPINDANGNVVAFTARVSPEKEATEQMGKYINSPQTILYNKSQIIFALDRAKQAIKQNDQVIIVEGQMDAITAHQFGYKNIIASSGTALTKEQIGMLKRFTNNFALAFDTDEAGHMAADRGIREAMKQDINISVIVVPEGKDPDDCIRNNKDNWEKAVKEAKHMMAYYFERTFSKLDLSRIEGKRSAAAKLLPIISDLENPIEKSYWLKLLGDNLGVDESVLKEAMNAKRSKTPSYPSSDKLPPQELAGPKAAQRGPKSRDEQLSEFFLAILTRFPALIEYATTAMSLEYLKGEENTAIYKNLIFYYNYLNQSANRTMSDRGLDLVDFSAWYKEFSKENSNISSQKNTETKIDIFDQLLGLNKLVLLGDKEYFELDYEQAKTELIRIIIQLKKSSLMERMKELEGLIAKSERERDEKAGQMLMEELKILSDEYRGLLS